MNNEEINHPIIHQLVADVGYIKAKVEGIDDLIKKVNQHDVALGKFGIVFTILVFAVTTAVSLATDFVKKIWTT